MPTDTRKPKPTAFKAILRWLDTGEDVEGIQFSMAHYHFGGKCCIGGYADVLAYREHGCSMPLNLGSFGTAALDRCRWLNITHKTHYDLFEPSQKLVPIITRQWAAACVRHFLKTGDVDWQGTKPINE